MEWVILIIAGLLEPVWASILKSSDGMTRLWPSVAGIAISLVSLFMLAISMRSLSAGTAYAVWVGIGVCGVVVAGMVIFGESASLPRLGFLALTLIGIVGLKLVEG